ncbi:NAD-dependent epimerase/dehydratase family protein [Saccharothrix coeruleofusca]|uniref:Nucleoside-diphosphate sugar epimerase n=1 Tax=Saccharothrix coeruleofusca TaxID=33919 RepID=A0A918ASL2_9PSEU|nr:NAD-dependent epimerase/dehydratase family protein [Saccharothrix coeruleofusca]MBP2336731.1 UDP-glucose 4-epimerase/UDP-glucuronate decarboxylase [Saccharothrix coeruleofusca]GGP78448.1 nucleoside-diphosphate sugar epimerase [Saccharothrix coeruleofusca]
MRHLVLGGAGFIGVHLTRRLLADGHEVTIVDDFSRGRRDPELDELGVPVISADLTDPASLDGVPHEFERVHLLAAVVGVRNVERDPARVINVNTLAVLNALRWVEPHQKLFFASTSETYAGGVDAGVVPVPTGEDVPLVVQDVTSPRFAYAVSKMLGEAAVVHTGRAKGVPVVVGRFHNVYGPRMGADHVIPELSLRAIRREDPFRVYGTDQFRAFCHVDDAVDAVVRLVEAEDAAGRIVHIGNDSAETNIGELAELVLKIAGHSPELERVPAPPGSVHRRCPDLTRLRALTGFEPEVSLEDGVRRTFEWYRDNWA